MRVLVTGASGFLGRYVLDCLRRQSIETVTLGRSLAPGSGDSAFIKLDLLAAADFSSMVRESAATHLLHLAWYTEHGKYWTSPFNLRWVEATIRLVEAFCEAGGQQAVLAGSCAEYDWSHGYCQEDYTPLNPNTLYGTAKDATRRLVTTICAQHQVPCAWGRLFLPFGTGESNQRLIPALIDVFRGRRQAFGVNATAYRDFLHASDVAEGLAALLQSGTSGSYNVSSGDPVQVATVVLELAKLLGSDPQAVLGLTTERPGEPPLLVGENLKLKSLGWLPELSLAQGLERTVRDLH